LGRAAIPYDIIGRLSTGWARGITGAKDPTPGWLHSKYLPAAAFFYRVAPPTGLGLQIFRRPPPR
jgi:hypothetical protein